MPLDSTLPPRPVRPWYATDSGRAGVALSVVTISVLAVGFAVIHGASSADPTSPTAPTASSKSGGALTPAPLENREQWIVIKGTASAPTRVPTPNEDAQGVSLPNMAERPGDATLERL